MNEFLTCLLTRIEEKRMWGRLELKGVILEEFNKIGGIRTLLESALSPNVTEEGRIIVIKEAIKEINRSL